MLLHFKITAVDFDGTLCEEKWPQIGEPNHEVINYIKGKKAAGEKIILWTCRSLNSLAEALIWCSEQGLEFDAVNDNIPEILEMFDAESRKIYYDELVDDKHCTRFKLPFKPETERDVAATVEYFEKGYTDQELVADIIEVFEEFLDVKNIVLQNDEKTEDPDAANLYGTDYGLVQDGIEELLTRRGLIKPVSEDDDSHMRSWAGTEIDIACKRERAENADPDGKEWDYGCACYESAYKAFKSMMSDGHSGFSINLTKYVLNRLIENKPLTPIEDTPDVWSDILDRRDDIGYTCYQNRRMSTLFKYIYDDGRVRYKDVDNNVFINLENDSSWHNGIVQDICDELFPITMPYSPGSAPYKFYGEECLTNKKNGDYDTVGILYMIKPSGERVKINRYFKELKDGSMKRICNLEYVLRKVLRVD